MGSHESLYETYAKMPEDVNDYSNHQVIATQAMLIAMFHDFDDDLDIQEKTNTD